VGEGKNYIRNMTVAVAMQSFLLIIWISDAFALRILSIWCNHEIRGAILFVLNVDDTIQEIAIKLAKL